MCVLFCDALFYDVLWYDVLCCDVLWCAVLWYDVTCCAVLCCDVLCNAILCYAMLFYGNAVMWYDVLFCDVLCHAMLRRDVMWCAILCCPMLCWAMLYCDVVCCDVMCYTVMWCAVMCYALLWYAMLWYDVLCFAVMCYAVIWCAIFFFCHIEFFIPEKWFVHSVIKAYVFVNERFNLIELIDCHSFLHRFIFHKFVRISLLRLLVGRGAWCRWLTFFLFNFYSLSISSANLISVVPDPSPTFVQWCLYSLLQLHFIYLSPILSIFLFFFLSTII